MLTTDDIAEMFAAMRIAYGTRWKHGEKSIPFWRRALAGASAEDIGRACDRWMDHDPDNPPTMPQFRNLVRTLNRQPSSGYLPPPHPSSPAMAEANVKMLRALGNAGGVDRQQLELMIELKSALVDELGDAEVTDAWAEDVGRQLYELAKDHDREAKRREAADARRRFFGTYPGFGEDDVAIP